MDNNCNSHNSYNNTNKTEKPYKEKIHVYTLVACIYFVSMPLSIVPMPGDISLLKFISYFSGSALILALFLGKNDNWIRFNTVHLFLGLYIIYSISSLFLLYDTGSWINLRGILETAALFFLITFRVYNPRERKFLLYSWLVSGIITFVIMFVSGVEFETSERFTLGLGAGVEDPNQLCGYFFIPLLICIDNVMKKVKYRFIYLLLILAMIFIVFTTGSRGGLIAIFAAIGAFGIIGIKGLYNKLKGLAAAILAVLLFIGFFYPLLTDSIKDRIKIESVIEDRGSGRFDLWAVTYDAITQSNTSLIFGNGLGSTSYFLQEVGGQGAVAHNHWLQIWCDQGFIGLLVFAGIIFFGGLRGMKEDTIISASLFGMFALSMSLTLYAYYKPFWNVLMMSAMNYEGVKQIEI